MCLEILDLARCSLRAPVVDGAFRGATSLRELSFFGNAFGVDYPGFLSGELLLSLTNLQQLDLGGTGISDGYDNFVFFFSALI